MKCEQFQWLVSSFLHRELDDADAAAVEEHSRACSACHRHLMMEKSLDRVLQSVVVSVPDGLESRLRAIVARESTGAEKKVVPLRRKFAWGVGTLVAASLILGLTVLVLSPGELQGPGELEGTIVCLGCVIEPESLPEQHQQHRATTHVNALKLADGKIWHLFDEEAGNKVATDDALLGERVLVRGQIFPQLQTISVMNVERLALSAALKEQQRLARDLVSQARLAAR